MKLRLYSAEGANCCDRVLWVLNYKGLRYELADPNAPEHTAEFTRISPFGRVPVLVASDQPLSESMAIAEFAEELVPDPTLLGQSMMERAQIREVCEAVNSSIHPVQNSSVVRYFQPHWSKEQMQSVRAAWIEQNLRKLEPKLWRSSPFVVGVAFSLADIFVAVIFRKAVSLGSPEELLPRFSAHWRHLLSIPEVEGSCPIARQ